MPEFQLFRVQVYPSQQTNMFQEPKNHADILEETIKSMPAVELRSGMTWIIGNIARIDDSSYYFRVGRIRKTRVEVYKDGNFQEMEEEQAPYTHVILDSQLEVCAIAKKTNLSQRIYGIASQLSNLLNRSQVAQRLRATFGIGAINDPTEFIMFLREAMSVKKVWLTFTQPNAWDAEEDFEKPLKNTLKEINGNRGKVEIEGSTLKTNNLEDLFRSVAAVGNDAGAVVELKEEEKTITKHKHVDRQR